MDDIQLLNRIKYAQEELKKAIAAQDRLLAILAGGYSPKEVVEFPELDVAHVFLAILGHHGDTPNFTYKLKINKDSATWVGGEHPWGGSVRNIYVNFPKDME